MATHRDKLFLLILPVAAQLFLLPNTGVSAEVVATVVCEQENAFQQEDSGEKKPDPKAQTRYFGFDQAVAKKLAYFQSGSSAILAPVNWECSRDKFDSGGSYFWITPKKTQNFPANYRGPGIFTQRFNNFGGDDDALTYARFVRRLFKSDPLSKGADLPKYRSDFPDWPKQTKALKKMEPYPHDRLTRIGPLTVIFETPAHHRGIGACFWDGRCNTVSDFDSIGIADFEDDSISITVVRLPKAMSDLKYIVFCQFVHRLNLD